MLRHLRRSHLLLSFLFLALPGTGGLVLQAFHHCSVAAPWEAQDHADQDSGHQAGHGQHGEPSSQDEPHPCTCVGQCATASLAAGPAPAVARLQSVEGTGRPARFVLPHAPLPGRTPHLLPPANAPPLS